MVAPHKVSQVGLDRLPDHPGDFDYKSILSLQCVKPGRVLPFDPDPVNSHDGRFLMTTKWS